MKKTDRRPVVAGMTILSAGLFMAVTAVCSLTPFSGLGNANRFGSPGMFSALLTVGIMYFIPLALYVLKVRFIRGVLAAVVGIYTLGSIGILIVLPLLSAAPAVQLINRIYRADIRSGLSITSAIACLLCAAEIAVNIAWYVTAFRRER